MSPEDKEHDWYTKFPDVGDYAGCHNICGAMWCYLMVLAKLHERD